jgi:hypothetical protein
MVKASLLLAVVYLSLSLDAAFACCLNIESPSAEVKNADAIFSGQVIEVSPTEAGEKITTFKVEKIWKGINSPTMSVSTSTDSVGSHFEVGETWLVYAYGKDKLSTDICTRTTLLKNLPF